MWIRRTGVFIALIICTGCHPAAAVLAGPAIGRAVEREQIRRATDIGNLPASGQTRADAGKGWSRRWQTIEGRALNAERYRQGEAVEIVWRIPFGVESGVGGAALFADPTCQRTQNDPDKATAVYGADARVRPEVWQIGETGSRSQRQLSYIAALRLFGNQSAVGEFPKWLIITPKEGDYLLELVWRDTSLVALQAVRPCIRLWKAVSMDLVVAATDAISLPAATIQRASPVGNTDKISISEQNELFGLSGNPVIDMPKLHNLALDVEFGGVRLNEAGKNAAMSSRARIIGQLLQDTAGKSNLCRMTRLYRLNQRSMALWNGEPTVNSEAFRRGDCS